MKTKIEMSFTEIGCKIVQMLEDEEKISSAEVELIWKWNKSLDRATLTIVQEG